MADPDERENDCLAEIVKRAVLPPNPSDPIKCPACGFEGTVANLSGFVGRPLMCRCGNHFVGGQWRDTERDHAWDPKPWDLLCIACGSDAEPPGDGTECPDCGSKEGWRSPPPPPGTLMRCLACNAQGPCEAVQEWACPRCGDAGPLLPLDGNALAGSVSLALPEPQAKWASDGTVTEEPQEESAAYQVGQIVARLEADRDAWKARAVAAEALLDERSAQPERF